jgi:hypothetical protein
MGAAEVAQRQASDGGLRAVQASLAAVGVDFLEDV